MRTFALTTGWLAVAALLTIAAVCGIASANATTTPAKPPWLHVGRVRHYQDCHGAGVRVWQTAGNTSALHCKNGKTYLS